MTHACPALSAAVRRCPLFSCESAADLGTVTLADPADRYRGLRRCRRNPGDGRMESGVGQAIAAFTSIDREPTFAHLRASSPTVGVPSPAFSPLFSRDCESVPVSSPVSRSTGSRGLKRVAWPREPRGIGSITARFAGAPREPHFADELGGRRHAAWLCESQAAVVNSRQRRAQSGSFSANSRRSVAEQHARSVPSHRFGALALPFAFEQPDGLGERSVGFIELAGKPGEVPVLDPQLWVAVVVTTGEPQGEKGFARVSPPMHAAGARRVIYGRGSRRGPSVV